MSNYSYDIKQAISMKDVCAMYGIEVNRNGFAKCVWHSDRTPSLKIYNGMRGCHCFACGEGGSVIDFTMQFFGLNFKDACAKLNDDFRLGLPINKELSREEQRIADREARKRREEQAKIKREGELLSRRYHSALDRYVALDRTLTANKPKSVDDITPEYAEALKQLPIAKYNLEQTELALYAHEHKETA